MFEDKALRLRDPHVARLTDLVEEWRKAISGEEWIPDFDPDDGGIDAEILLLLEKPGPGPDNGGVRYVSQDNRDRTAENIKTFLLQAGIKRPQLVLWNAFPVWNGERRILAHHRPQAKEMLAQLLEQLPQLKFVVCVGLKSQDLLDRMPEALRPDVFRADSYHPSPIVERRYPEKFESIPEVWRKFSQITRASE
jgi:hypothetical protein